MLPHQNNCHETALKGNFLISLISALISALISCCTSHIHASEHNTVSWNCQKFHLILFPWCIFYPKPERQLSQVMLSTQLPLILLMSIISLHNSFHRG